MSERLVAIPIPAVYPGAAAALSTTFTYINVPFDCTIVYVCAAASADDTGLTLDINDDGSGVIEGIDCADKEDPGEWISTHMGGAQTPVRVAAGSELSFDANNAANATVINGYILVLTSDVYA